jgi:predicted DsbA family dithiol-disulfide isomerase
MVRIEILSDTICPWCFIGKRRLERALAARPELRVEVAWRPFQLNPDMPAEGMEREAYYAAKFGDGKTRAAIFARVIAAGAEEGIAFNFPAIRRTPNTLSSHRLIRWAGEFGRQNAVVELIFRRYFLDGENIGDHTVLVAIAREAGLDAAAIAARLAENIDIDRVLAEDQYARSLGIRGVPFFIVDRKYAVSGAQDPSIFHQLFDLAGRDAALAS